jgi:hypothetical protein
MNTVTVSLAHRPIHEVAREIRRTWGAKVNYAARPYLDAMMDLEKITDDYGADDGKSIIVYFLGNASSFRGEDAKRLKAELKAIAGVK